MENKKLLNETENMLKNIVGEEDASEILNNMFPKPIKGYKKGKILTVGELKKLPDGTVIHLCYRDEYGDLRTNDFTKIYGMDNYDSISELYTENGYPVELKNHSEDELIKNFNNDDWLFSISVAIKLKN